MKLTQRLLVLLITVTMMLSGSFVQAFATEEAVDGGSVVASETAGSEDTKEEVEEEAKEEDKEEAKEEEKEETKEEDKVEEPKAEEAKEVAPEKEEPKAETESKASDESNAEPEKEAAAKDDSKDAEEYSAGTLTYECDEYTVTLEYGKKAEIPTGTKLEVREVLADSDSKREQKEYEEYYDKSLEQLRSEKGGDSIAKLEFAKFYDITLISKGKEIEPSGDVSVKFAFNEDSREKVGKKDEAEKSLRVVHLTENEKTGKLEAAAIDKKDTDLSLEKKELSEASFTTDSFSVYGIVYTVDFEYEGYTFSIEGESDILISEVFERLHIEEDASKVENVEFTDPKLIKVEQTDGDWKLTSLKPFNTEEKLTITLPEKVIEIKVTDAQSGNTFILRRNNSSNERFSTELFSSRAGETPELVGDGDVSIPHSGITNNWMDIGTVVAEYNSDYSSPRYSVLSAKDIVENRELCAIGFYQDPNPIDIFNLIWGAFGLYTKKDDGVFGRQGKGSNANYDLQIYLNDNSLHLEIYVDGTEKVTDNFVNKINTKTAYNAAELAKEYGYEYDPSEYVLDSSIDDDYVSSVSVSEMTGQSLAGKSFDRPRATIGSSEFVIYSPKFEFTYPKAYKWTYNNKTVGNKTYVINFVPPIARVSNDGVNWTYHAYLINPDNQPGSTVKAGAFDQANSLNGDVIVEMLYDTHERYSLSSGFNFNNSAIDSLTINGVDPGDTTKKTTLVKDQTANRIVPMITTAGIDKVELNQIIFDGNNQITTNAHGGAVSTNAKNLTVNSCEFNKCQAGYQGGGINHNNPAGTVTINNSKFSECRANGPNDNTGGGGGGVFTNAKTLTVQNESSFENCTTNVRQGAGIFHKREKGAAPSETTIKDSTFNKCVASWSGGGIETDATTVTLNHTNFTGCEGNKGGAVNVYADNQETSQSTTLDVINCNFISCKSGKNTGSSNGGAVRSTSFSTNITDSSFEGCTSTANGGAVACTNKNGKAEITGSTFSNCKAANGGAISSNGMELTVSGGSIRGCSATTKGGGIDFKAFDAESDAANTTLKVVGVTFGGDEDSDACTAKENGGAIRSSALNITIENATFKKCSSTTRNGGAVANSSNKANLDITNCTFYDCHADNGSGGACFTAGPNLTVNGETTIDSCSAKNGGGIFSASQNVTMNAGTIKNCFATENGGAINGTKITMNGGTISSCTADNNGGAINGASQIIVNGGAISGCTAKEKGGALYSGKTITMTGGSVTGNKTLGESAAVHADRPKPGIFFEGNVVVADNIGAEEEPRDVYVDYYSGENPPHTDRHIQINEAGLGDNARIGIYEKTGEPYDYHGKEGQLFARTGDGNPDNLALGGYPAAQMSNLDKLFNDRDVKLHGVAAVAGSGDNWEYRVMWSGETPIAPTNVNLRMMPYILILLGGAALVLLKKTADRRRKDEDDTCETEE